MKSIIQEEKECFVCKTISNLQEHHIFQGMNRSCSEKYGLKVWLCLYHHTGSNEAVHHNKALMDYLHKIGQEKFEETHTREEFRKIFGRSYL